MTWTAVRETTANEWLHIAEGVDTEGIRSELSMIQQDALYVFTRLMAFFAEASGNLPVSLWPAFRRRILEIATASTGQDVAGSLNNFGPWAHRCAQVRSLLHSMVVFH